MVNRGERVAEIAANLLDEIGKSIVGKELVLKQIMAAILAGGHILLEDYPGLAKTEIAKSFAGVFDMKFKRIQFTPDLLPGDITGGYIYNRMDNRFELRKGPIFSNLVLADEINRASPKTQSALLEAMQERQVTVEGETLPLPDPFIVIATQNPIDYEGTFPLPEAQLDRFLIKLSVGYPSRDEEREILHRNQRSDCHQYEVGIQSSGSELLRIRRFVDSIFVHPDMERYIVDIVHSTRKNNDIEVGASPRGSLALMKLARSWAVISGRDYILPDDIKQFAAPALTHRISLAPALWMNRSAPSRIIESICRSIPVPAVEKVG